MRLPKKIKVLVTAIGAPPGRNVVRALLKHENVELCGADAMLSQLKHFPYAIPTFSLPKANADDYPNELLTLLEREKIDLLIPCIEEEVLRITAFQEQLREHGVAVFVPPTDSLLMLLDKEQLQSTAEMAGVPFLQSVRINELADLSLLETFPLPFVTKPLIGYGAKGVRIFEHSKENLQTAIQEDLIKYGGLLAQTYVPGGAGSIFLHCAFFDRAGNARLHYQSYSTKTLFDFGGPATAGVSIWDKALYEQFKKIMAVVPKWVGPIVLEFKKHAETGEYYVMDANPRIWGYSSLADDVGLPFPLAYVLEALRFSYAPSTGLFVTGAQMERKADQRDETSFRFADGKTNIISRLPTVAMEEKNVAWVGKSQTDFANAPQNSNCQWLYLSDEKPPMSLAEKVYWFKPQGNGSWEDELYRAAVVMRANLLQWNGGETDFDSLQEKVWHVRSN